MFFRRRTGQAEYFDTPGLDLAEMRETYRWLNRVNRITRFEMPFRVWIPRLLDPSTCGELAFLDVGGGDGELGRTLAAWASARGWRWSVTTLEPDPRAAALDVDGRRMVGSALAIPVQDGAYDVVIANTMAHHLPDEAAVATHFREAARAARRLVLLCDMRRGLRLYVGVWLLSRWIGAPATFRGDGLISVRRGWRAAEWRRLAVTAGLHQARVWEEYAARVVLAFRPDIAPLGTN